MATDVLTVKVEFDEENAMNCIKNVLMNEYGMTLDELAELCKANQVRKVWRNEMNAAFCDVCKKPVNRWYRIQISVDASRPEINVGDMIKNFGSYDVCDECLKKIKDVCKNERF